MSHEDRGKLRCRRSAVEPEFGVNLKGVSRSDVSSTAETARDGVPPGMHQVESQRPAELRADRVSVCLAKCRLASRVVQGAVQRLGWEDVLRDTPEVSVVWLEHADPMVALSPSQITSRIDGFGTVGRKVDMAACMQLMQESYPADYKFVPRTWILSPACPEQVADLEKTMTEKKGWTYIYKPTSGSLGRGIRLVRTFKELRGPLRDVFSGGRSSGGVADVQRPYVVQRYVSRPLLVDGYKFDCRCYVVVTSVVPLRAYLFKEGLARLCTTRYERPRGRNLGTVCMHLTNYDLNKRSDAFCASQAHDDGSKRSISSVFAAVEAEGGPSQVRLWGEIQSLAEKTIVALRPALVERIARGDHSALHPAGPKGFHTIGFDVLFDETFQPHLLELNAHASMGVLLPKKDGGVDCCSTEEVSELDLAVKEELICQALLCANPLPHRIALQRHVDWIETRKGASADEEPIPLDDDGRPASHSQTVGLGGAATLAGSACTAGSVGTDTASALFARSIAASEPRPDRPDRCPTLRPLNFNAHASMGYARAHLLAYRVWRRHASRSSFRSCSRGSVAAAACCGGAASPSTRSASRPNGSLDCVSCESILLAAGLSHDTAQRVLAGAARAHGDSISKSTPSSALRGCSSDSLLLPSFTDFLQHIVFPAGEVLAQKKGRRITRATALEALIARLCPPGATANTVNSGRQQVASGALALSSDGVCRDDGADCVALSTALAYRLSA
eukprot:TRINITY_DN38565_c0_g1_i1.p1 TRINITY_DN38565_c0_g1~~TRINITY_DN38565_c0_g1_i1.p1  ORF type:complete len:822 (-),score=103.90 TRINITY_DN38565_c0_g1_i1:114-2312(-)